MIHWRVVDLHAYWKIYVFATMIADDEGCCDPVKLVYATSPHPFQLNNVLLVLWLNFFKVVH